jgi:autotransporter-associated beta strand protein
VAIYNALSTQADAITISGGTVTSANTANNSGTIYLGASGTLTVSSNGKVKNTAAGSGIYDYANAVYLAANGAKVEVKDNGSVEAMGAYGAAIQSAGLSGDRDITVTVSGGTVSATSGTAIYSNGNTVVTISGGTVSATTGDAIHSLTSAHLTISGGTVSAKTGRAIYSGNSDAVINITGGTVTSENVTGDIGTIYLEASGTLNISDNATVRNTAIGNAIYLDNSGAKVSISGGTVEATAAAGGVAIYNALSTGSGGTDAAIAITGGTVSATSGAAIYSAANGTIAISGGAVSATTGKAIHNTASPINISGTATVSATGENGVAIYNTGTGNVSISGTATVSATGNNGIAIHNTGTGSVSISGDAKVEGDKYAIKNEDGTVTISDTGSTAGSGLKVTNIAAGYLVYSEGGTINIGPNALFGDSTRAKGFIYIGNGGTLNLAGGNTFDTIIASGTDSVVSTINILGPTTIDPVINAARNSDYNFTLVADENTRVNITKGENAAAEGKLTLNIPNEYATDYTGIIAGDGTLRIEIAADNTQTFSNSNPFTGDMEVTGGGTVKINGTLGTDANYAGNLDVAQGTILEFAPTADQPQTYSGSAEGGKIAGEIKISGPGTFTLSGVLAGGDSTNGKLTVSSGGVFALNGGNVTLPTTHFAGNGSTLAGAGQISSDTVSFDNGTVISPGEPNAQNDNRFGTIELTTAESITYSGITYKLNLANTDTNTQNDLLTHVNNIGTVIFGGSNTIDIIENKWDGTNNLTYTILKAAGGITAESLSSTTIHENGKPPNPRHAYSLSLANVDGDTSTTAMNTGLILNLSITNFEIYWGATKAASGHVWKNEPTEAPPQNFYTKNTLENESFAGDNPPLPDSSFVNGDIVHFGAYSDKIGAATGDINVATDGVTPHFLGIEGNGTDIVFKGGDITITPREIVPPETAESVGESKLLVTGGAKVRFENTVAGGADNSGTVVPDTLFISEGAEVTIGGIGGELLLPKVVFDGNTQSTLKFDKSATDYAPSYEGTISGAGNVEKGGSGVFTLNGAHTYTGSTSVTDSNSGTDGTLKIAGTLGTDANYAGNLTVAAGATLEFVTSEAVNQIYSGTTYSDSTAADALAGKIKISGPGTFTLTGSLRSTAPGSKLTVDRSTLVLVSDSAYEGTGVVSLNAIEFSTGENGNHSKLTGTGYITGEVSFGANTEISPGTSPGDIAAITFSHAGKTIAYESIKYVVDVSYTGGVNTSDVLIHDAGSVVFTGNNTIDVRGSWDGKTHSYTILKVGSGYDITSDGTNFGNTTFLESGNTVDVGHVYSLKIQNGELVLTAAAENHGILYWGMSKAENGKNWDTITSNFYLPADIQSVTLPDSPTKTFAFGDIVVFDVTANAALGGDAEQIVNVETGGVEPHAVDIRGKDTSPIFKGGTITITPSEVVEGGATSYEVGSPYGVGDSSASFFVQDGAVAEFQNTVASKNGAGGLEGDNTLHILTGAKVIVSEDGAIKIPNINLGTHTDDGTILPGTLEFKKSGTDSNLDYDGIISGAGHVVLTGVGDNASFTLKGNHTYTGDTRVSGGTLEITGGLGTVSEDGAITGRNYTGKIELTTTDDARPGKITFSGADGYTQVLSGILSGGEGTELRVEGRTLDFASDRNNSPHSHPGEPGKSAAALGHNTYAGGLYVGANGTLTVSGRLNVIVETFDGGTPWAKTYQHSHYSGNIEIASTGTLNFTYELDYQLYSGTLTGAGNLNIKTGMPFYYTGDASGWTGATTVAEKSAFHLSANVTYGAEDAPVKSFKVEEGSALYVGDGGKIYTQNFAMEEKTMLVVAAKDFEIKMSDPGNITFTETTFVFRISKGDPIAKDDTPMQGKLAFIGVGAGVTLESGQTLRVDFLNNLNLPTDQEVVLMSGLNVNKMLYPEGGTGAFPYEGNDEALVKEIFSNTDFAKMENFKFRFTINGELRVGLARESSNIPEPGTYGLFSGVFIVGMALLRRRKKNALAKNLNRTRI